MPQDYYDDGGHGPTGPGSGPAADAEGEDESHDEGSTAVVPQELCPGMKVGDEMVLKIVSVDQDSYEVKYAPSKDKGGADEEEPGDVKAPDKMASMLE